MVVFKEKIYEKNNIYWVGKTDWELKNFLKRPFAM
jgi:hypothetical protein